MTYLLWVKKLVLKLDLTLMECLMDHQYLERCTSLPLKQVLYCQSLLGFDKQICCDDPDINTNDNLPDINNDVLPKYTTSTKVILKIVYPFQFHCPSFFQKLKKAI
jgi:hypothetical protein